MNTKRVVFTFFLLLYVSPTHTEIVVHASHAPLVDYIAQAEHASHEILVIFDIDNTIAHPKTEVGSDQWIEYHAKQQMTTGMSIREAFQTILPLYYKIQHLIDLHLVEELIPELIADLKCAGICVIGLTARSHPIIDRTLAQLAPLNVTFSNLADQEIVIQGNVDEALYKQGIIFCGNNSKGVTLFTLLTMLGLSPKKIFFIDDKMHHLINVETMALERGIECICIHYTRCQERVDNFDPEQAERELQELSLAMK